MFHKVLLSVIDDADRPLLPEEASADRHAGLRAAE
jgi:hypothetical protein